MVPSRFQLLGSAPASCAALLFQLATRWTGDLHFTNPLHAVPLPDKCIVVHVLAQVLRVIERSYPIGKAHAYCHFRHDCCSLSFLSSCYVTSSSTPS